MNTRHLLRIRALTLSFTLLLISLLNSSFSQTVTKTYTAPSSVSIDGCGTYCSSLPGVTFTTADFPIGCSVTDVNVNIVWAKTDGSCTAPATGSSFHGETSFRIDGPMGVNEILVLPGTYSGSGSTSATSTTLDQAAATIIGGVDPVSGTFRPNNGNLNNFNGTNGLGTWFLRAGDTGTGDPLCVVSYSVTLTMSGTPDNASFGYSLASYCVNAADPTPTITGDAGGTFSSTAGLSLNTATGAIDVSASTPGTYSVTYTTPTPCSNTSSVNVTINALDNAGFSYSASSYCTNAVDPAPTITGLAGGTFSSTAGLTINASTGVIDVSASTPGIYSVNYVTNGACPNGTVVSVTIVAADNAGFNYSSASYCVNAADPTPTITGLIGGTFSSTAGLSLNASSGAIDVSASTPGTYSVTYTTTGTCPNTSSASVTINGLDNAGFNYSAASYCANVADPTPTITGLTGGTFSSTAGLTINASTGVIDVSASTPGTYSVTYTTSGACTNSSVVSVTVNAADNAGFNYSAAAYCVNAVDPTPTITGAAGGTFSSTAGLSINTSTGVIDVSASTPGTYSVTYTTTGACPNSSSVSVTITALDNAGFSYSAPAYCMNAIDPTPTITGLAGGTFSSTAGLSINASTGVIDVSASTAGTYTVSYATAGTCPNSSSVSVTINTIDNAGFSYSAAAYCVNAVDPTPTITGAAGGTFSSTAGLSINTSTGVIDVSASTPGTYSVTYTTAGTCPNSSSVSVTVNALDNAGFTYSAAAYCMNVIDPTPTITGVAGGTFSSTAGLSINTSTGVIDVSASTPGTYSVTYSTAGTCPNSSSVSVTVNALDNAGFNYSAAAYCVNAIDPTPTITGLAGGTFSSTAGLSINASTGVIDVSASTPGTYSVTYTTAGTCPNSSSVSVTVNALDNAGFSYSAAAYCVNAIDPTPTITGVAGGTFSSTAGLSINTSTGVIDVSASAPGTYSVTYTTAGTCPNSSSVSVTVNALDNAGFSYSAAAYCVNAADPTPTITGLAGGTFSSAAGLSINASTGVIDVSASTPGIYSVTYTTAGTCPNSSSVSVTVNDVSTGTDVQVACDSYTWIDGMTYTTSNNSATFIVMNAAGCDSVITLNLTINTATTGVDTQVACDSYTWIDGITYTASNNTATFTVMNAAGCDSVVTLNLTINTSTTGTDTQIACDSYTWIDGITYTASNNSAVFTVLNAAGCDSVVTLNLTINNSTTGTDTQVACDTYTWIDGNTYTASNNVATFLLGNAAGCDSLVTLDLTINYSASSSITEVSCGDYLSPGGNTYTTSGTYTELLLTGAGCDSILTINLTIETVDVSVSVADITMTANYAGGTYQWINCTTLAPIAGATGQSFTPFANGDYAVIVSTGNCSDTSACTTINSVKLTELELAEMIQLYPNPATENYVTIGYDGIISSVDVYDVMGRVMIQGVQPSGNKLDVSGLSYGKYIVRITTESAVIMKELIIAR